MKMTIELQSVGKNLNSILVLNDYSEEDYQKFRKGFDFFTEKASESPEILQDGMEDAIEKEFHSLVNNYLERIGLEASPESTYYYTKEKNIHMRCKGFKLLTDRKEPLDGFEPNLTFQLNPNKLSVSSILELKGAYFLNILPDILQIYYPKSRADGINYPIIKSIGSDIQIASVEQIQPVMKESKLRIEQIGTDEDLRELAEIKALSNDKKISKLGLTERMREKYSLKLLEKLGVDFFPKKASSQN